MPVNYAKLGIRFEYPENWILDEEEARDTRNAATVYAPSGAFWSVNLQPADDGEPQALIDSVLETLRQEYPDIDEEPVRETVEDWDMIGYEANFYCLDLTNTAQIRAVPSPFGTFVIVAQAEDREYERLGPVFRAMTISLLRNSLGKGTP
ncbi:MAG: hypothetical protein K8T91_08070 [Planctomycetes bacterium]|nr:hypothetical protein [Planctomycetota bacterium]